LTSIALTGTESVLTAVAGRRIPRRAWSEVRDMNVVLSEADRVMHAAKRQAELLQRRAYFEGRSAGLTNAQAEAIKLVLEAQKQARELVAASEMRIVELAVSIVARIAPRLGQGELVAALAAEGLAAIQDERHICIRIGNAAEKATRAMLDRWQSAHPEVDADLLVDPSLDPMACVVETDLGRIEVGLSAQLEAVRSALAVVASEPPPPSQPPQPQP
jgi:type III secretion protein L